MRIVLASYSLEGIGGSETYVVTVSDHLQRLGHDVWLHTERTGRGSDLAADLGIRVAASASELPGDPDAVVVQDGVVACELAVVYPHVPQAFVAHSDIFDLQLPPQLPELTSVVITLYDRVDRRIRAMALEQDVVRLSQPVDVERFKPIRPLPERPGTVLLFGNYVHGDRVEMVRRACAAAGLDLRHVGLHGDGVNARPELLINEADIVIGKARAIVEAMASGRAAYVFDHNGGEGWVTADAYPQLSADNFGGQGRPAIIDHERLAADFAGYDPEMGVVNRDLAVAHHSATKHAASLAAVLARLAPRRAPVDAPLQELARMVRLYHRADQQAFLLRAHSDQLEVRFHDLRGEVQRLAQDGEQLRGHLEQLRAELNAARADSERAQAELERARVELELALADCAAAQDRCVQIDDQLSAARADADAARQAFMTIASTRRWRIIQGFLRPLDRVRGR